MKDITERLIWTPCLLPDELALRKEAAAEIERLRAQLEVSPAPSKDGLADAAATNPPTANQLMPKDYWTEKTTEFRLTAREGDVVRICPPCQCGASKYKDQEGQISGFWDDWVIVDLSPRENNLRFRPDELKIL